MVLPSLGTDTMVRSSKMPFLMKHGKSRGRQLLYEHPIRKPERMQILPDRTARPRPQPPDRAKKPPRRDRHEKHPTRPQYPPHLTEQRRHIRQVLQHVEGGDQIKLTVRKSQRSGKIGHLELEPWAMLAPVGNRAFGKINASDRGTGPLPQVRRQPAAVAPEVEDSGRLGQSSNRPLQQTQPAAVPKSLPNVCPHSGLVILGRHGLM